MKSCLNCEHGEISLFRDYEAFCYLDIGCYIKDAKEEAKSCKFYCCEDENEEEHKDA